MLDIPIFVIVNSSRGWLLPGFAHLFNRHWSKDQWISFVNQNGDPRGIHLPDNFAEYKIRKSTLYTDVLIALLKSIEDSYIILFHENDWLRNPVELKKLLSLDAWLKSTHDQVLRFDLVGERTTCKTARNWKGPCPRDIQPVYTPPGSDGLLSFTPSIWNRKMLLELLIPGESQVQAEQGGTQMMSVHCPGAVMGAGIIDRIEVCQTEDRVNLNGFDQNVVDYMRHRGYSKPKV